MSHSEQILRPRRGESRLPASCFIAHMNCPAATGSCLLYLHCQNIRSSLSSASMISVRPTAHVLKRAAYHANAGTFPADFIAFKDFRGADTGCVCAVSYGLDDDTRAILPQCHSARAERWSCPGGNDGSKSLLGTYVEGDAIAPRPLSHTPSAGSKNGV